MRWDHFIEACRTGHAAIVKALIEKGKFKVNKIYWQISPLNRAMHYGVDIVGALLDAGADPNGPMNDPADDQIRARHYIPPLLAAVKMNKLEVVNLLLERGAALAGGGQFDAEPEIMDAAKSLNDKRVHDRLLRAQADEKNKV